jgi:hypothetical protein
VTEWRERPAIQCRWWFEQRVEFVRRTERFDGFTGNRIFQLERDPFSERGVAADEPSGTAEQDGPHGDLPQSVWIDSDADILWSKRSCCCSRSNVYGERRWGNVALRLAEDHKSGL